MLYHHGVYIIFLRCLIHEEVELVLNECHYGSCGGHLSGMATSYKILHAEYFWPYIFKYCMEALKKCPPLQLFQSKKCTHPTLLHPVIVVDPSMKWGINSMHCKPALDGGHG